MKYVDFETCFVKYIVFKIKILFYCCLVHFKDLFTPLRNGYLITFKKKESKTSQYSQENTLFNSEYCEVLKSTYFEEHLRTINSILIHDYHPLDGTHLDSVRGLITKRFSSKCVNGKSSSERRYFVR